jgi:hypothetical protein
VATVWMWTMQERIVGDGQSQVDRLALVVGPYYIAISV